MSELDLDERRREELARVLAEHLPGDYTHLFHDDPGAVDPPVGCRCGWRHERGVSHHAHVADALAPLVAGWLADDTAVCTTCQHRGGDDQPAQHPGCAAALGRIRAAALREAAREAEERGDIGKDGGPEAWVWLDWRADRVGGTAAAGTRENGEGAHQGAPDAPAPGGSSTDVIPGPQIGAQRFEGER